MYLFVYGTLRRGMRYAHYLQGASLVVSNAWIQGELFDTGDGYPGLISGKGRVIGDIYQVDSEQLKRVDELEDYFGPNHPDNLYERVMEEINTKKGHLLAWVYYYCDTARLKQTGIWIPSGNWCK